MDKDDDLETAYVCTMIRCNFAEFVCWTTLCACCTKRKHRVCANLRIIILLLSHRHTEAVGLRYIDYIGILCMKCVSTSVLSTKQIRFSP